MATTTPNFGWPVPTSTDLVKDGATAIEALGDSIDASLLDLKGGTTGQVLSKNSNTDMDFTWVTDAAGDITGVTAGVGISGGGTSGTVTVTNSMATEITASGDIIVGTGSGTFDNLPIGTTGQILTADTTVSPYKIKWATPAASASGLTKITSATFSSVSSVSLPNSTFTSTYTNYKILITIQSTSGSPAITGRYRASGSDNTTSNYYSALSIARVDGSAATQGNSSATTSFNLGYVTAGAPGTYGLTLDFLGPEAAVRKQIGGTGFGANSGLDAFAAYSFGAWFNATTQFDAFSFIASTGTITGSYAVYGYQS